MPYNLRKVHAVGHQTMLQNFARNIAPYVGVELESAVRARMAGDPSAEFHHLENAHVLGQESTYWHTKAHIHMLRWAIRNRSVREAAGQLLRIVGAATKTAVGLVPEGNTGGTNVSPFQRMPIDPELLRQIEAARGRP